ncbi:MAG: cell division protein FtsQ/DivIB [Terracidiphilus sp.]
MTNQKDTNRPLLWEDEAPAVARVRRMQEGVPVAGRIRRGAPGMPLEMEDPDGDDELRSGARNAPRGKWWRPAGKAGRIFLTLGALIVLGVFTCLGLALRTYLERDARFRIAGAANIQATGLTEVSRADMLPIFGEDIGRNIFFVPLSERRKQLEQIPWVEHATVMRVLPDQIRVALVERQPVAFTRVGQQIDLVDGDGILLTMPAAAMAQHHYSFPVITGIDPGDPPASRQARMAVYGRLMSELDSGGQRLSQQISEIDLTDPEDARVLMPEQGADILAHFGQDRFVERYQRYKAHIAEWRQQYPNLAAVDLRYDQQVVLQMASGKQASQPAPGANGTQPTVDGKPAAGTPAGDAKPQPEKKPAANSATKSHAEHLKKKHAEQRHTALYDSNNLPPEKIRYLG